MKKLILAAIILALFTLGSKPVNRPLVKLTIINKSGEELSLRLDNIEPYYENHIIYNFKIPIGNKTNPTVRVFTIYKDIYTMQVSFFREWEPVYQYTPCNPGPHKIDYFATTNQRFTFTKCTQSPPRPGEATMHKVWQGAVVNQRNLRRMSADAFDPALIYGKAYWGGCYQFP